MQPGETIKPGGAAEPAAPAPAIEPAAVSQPAARADDAITWSASEYIAHDKPSSWYVMVGLGSAVLAILVYLLTRDELSTGVIVLVGLAFGVASSRQPRTLNYAIDQAGIMIGQKFYPFADFKSFAVMEEDAVYSILLLPMKRFMPGLSLYFPPDQEDEIMEAISNYLPHEVRPPDMVDRLARRLRF